MTIEIPLTRGLFALIDDEDLPLIAGKKWAALSAPNTIYAAHRFRAEGSRSVKTLYMHRVLLGISHLGHRVRGDHRDGDGLNNRRENLRPASGGQNAGNRRGSRDGCKGVMPCGHKWVAFFREAYIGTFETESDAGHAHDVAARAHYGEFACVNFPLPGERSALTGLVMPMLEIAA